MRTLIIITGFIFAMTFTSCATKTVVRSQNVKVIRVTPKNHKIVVVKGKRYYYWNGRHYKKTGKGYVVVKGR